MIRERRQAGRVTVDRRQSERWGLDRTFHWRVFRGRRVRIGRIRQRSLHGVVVTAQPGDGVSVGTRLVVTNEETQERLGFRTAVVRRATTRRNGVNTLFAEIES